MGCVGYAIPPFALIMFYLAESQKQILAALHSRSKESQSPSSVGLIAVIEEGIELQELK